MNFCQFRLALFLLPLAMATGLAQDFQGQWDAEIECPGGGIRFGLELKSDSGRWTAQLVNGPERIDVPKVEVNRDFVVLKIEHYDSTVTFQPDLESPKDRLAGTWKKRRGPNRWQEMKCKATRHRTQELEVPDPAFLGKFAVKFSSSDDPAVAIFKQGESNRIQGTFLTTTGDYRYLDGFVIDGRMELSCFDGAHAFLFHAQVAADGGLKGDFWSSQSWHETWTAKRNENAKLPDDMKQTSVKENVDWGALSFPDLDGNPVRLDDPRFSGKPRIIYVFGTWCPNCHDAGEYFASLDEKFGDQGLSILGLAFEHTGDFQRDADQVRRYLERHQANYPVLVAGLSSKDKASGAFPILDRVRSYPTTLFIDREGKIQAVHTGFTGPATGDAYEELKSKFEMNIRNLIKDRDD